MGGAASIPQYLDETTCRRLAGSNFDQSKFDSLQRSGRVAKHEFLKLAAEAGLLQQNFAVQQQQQQPLEHLQANHMVYNHQMNGFPSQQRHQQQMQMQYHRPVQNYSTYSQQQQPIHYHHSLSQPSPGARRGGIGLGGQGYQQQLMPMQSQSRLQYGQGAQFQDRNGMPIQYQQPMQFPGTYQQQQTQLQLLQMQQQQQLQQRSNGIHTMGHPSFQQQQMSLHSRSAGCESGFQQRSKSQNGSDWNFRQDSKQGDPNLNYSGQRMGNMGRNMTPNTLERRSDIASGNSSQTNVTNSQVVVGAAMNYPSHQQSGLRATRSANELFDHSQTTVSSPLSLGSVVRVTYSDAFIRANPGEPSDFCGKIVKNDGRICHIDFGRDGTFEFNLAGETRRAGALIGLLRDVDGFEVSVQLFDPDNREKIEKSNSAWKEEKMQSSKQRTHLQQSNSRPRAQSEPLPYIVPIVKQEPDPEPELELDLNMWIHHDNPTHAKRDVGMIVLVEGKTKSGSHLIIRGIIEQSGEMTNFDMGVGSKSGGTSEAHKGKFIVKLNSIRGFLYGNENLEAGCTKIEERVNPRTGDTDIRLRDSSALSGRSVIRHLNSCPGTISVIFDPQRQGGAQGWYPRKKDMRGNGKIVTIPASFRSNNIGYMRLGDDMNQFGNQFLSLDGGITFMNQDESKIFQSLGLLK